MILDDSGNYVLQAQDYVHLASTKDLVSELITREGVEYKFIDPYRGGSIYVEGPAILIAVID